jgi:hypothetical protein
MFPEIEDGEILVRLTAPGSGGRSGFCCGIVIRDDKVVRTAPIVGFMLKWPSDQVRTYCKSVGWTATVSRNAVGAKAA